MHVLKLEFYIFKICGYWRPVNWTSYAAQLIYNIYSAFMTFVMYTYMVSGFLDIIFNAKTLDDISANCYMMLTILSSCCKAGIMLLKHNDIICLANMLLDKNCKPLDENEEQIQAKFDKKARSNTICYCAMTEISVALVCVKAFLNNALNGELPFRAWLPFNYKRLPTIFWITYAHQMIGQITAATVNVGSECLVSGFMIQSCAQLEILKHRLEKVSSDDVDVSQNISKCVHYHNYIFQFSEKINNIFNAVIATQFTVTALVLCCSLYQLVIKADGNKLNSMALLSYLPCLLVQIFIYCWYGNEVMLKSKEVGSAAFQSQWDSLTVSSRKMLSMIIARSRVPIKFSSGYFITLSVDSFSKLLKISYSVYNVLQKS